MKIKSPYLNIEYVGGLQESMEYIVRVFMVIPQGKKAKSNMLRINGVKKKYRIGGFDTIDCSQFLVQLEDDPTAVQTVEHFESVPFIKPVGVKHIWITIDDDGTIQPDEGAVGNYDDPDG